MTMTNHQRSAEDLRDKLALEQKMALKLTKLFNRVADDFKQSMKDSGVPPSFDNWQSFFEDLLMSHYNATAEIFSSKIQDQLNLEATSDEKKQIAAALAIYFNLQAREAADIINQTNRDQASEAVTRMRAQEQEDIANGDPAYDSETRSAVANNIYRTLIFGRVTTIAASETQKAAEASKHVESDVINGNKPTINSAIPVGAVLVGDKTWSAILDDDTRDTHVAADGQTVKTSDYFIVGGYKMRFPGDRTAAVKEWINCRCNSIYTPSQSVLSLRRKR